MVGPFVHDRTRAPVTRSSLKVERRTIPRMIDFSSGSVFKLKEIPPQEVGPAVQPLLVEGEGLISAFKTVRDYVVFTNRRLITVNIQGITGKKQDFTSLPWKKVQAWSVETAGQFDLDAELEMWFSGLGKVRLEFKGAVDIRSIGQLIASYAL
jgi:hypothetical protein